MSKPETSHLSAAQQSKLDQEVAAGQARIARRAEIDANLKKQREEQDAPVDVAEAAEAKLRQQEAERLAAAEHAEAANADAVRANAEKAARDEAEALAATERAAQLENDTAARILAEKQAIRDHEAEQADRDREAANNATANNEAEARAEDISTIQGSERADEERNAQLKANAQPGPKSRGGKKRGEQAEEASRTIEGSGDPDPLA